MSERRYLIDLPVLVTVDDAGAVHAFVDLREAYQAPRDDLYRSADLVEDADSAAIGRAFDAHEITVEW